MKNYYIRVIHSSDDVFADFNHDDFIWADNENDAVKQAEAFIRKNAQKVSNVDADDVTIENMIERNGESFYYYTNGWMVECHPIVPRE